MKKLIVWILVIFLDFIGQLHSADWVSPIDKKYLEKNQELFEKYAEAHDLLDSYRGQSSRLRQAENLLNEIVSKDDQFAPAYREFGRLRILQGVVRNGVFKEGSLPSAEVAILKSLEIEPNYADSYVLLGHLYTRMFRFDDAEGSLRKAEQIGTEIPWLELNWADLLEKQGKLGEAVTRYNRVIEKGTSNKKAYASALSGATSIYMSTGQLEKADQAYQRELAYEPDSAWGWGNYASFQLFLNEDVDGAIESAKKALSIMNYGMGRFTLGCALYTKWAILKSENEHSVKADRYLKEAMKVYPYTENVIEEAVKYPYTMITADALRKLISKERS